MCPNRAGVAVSRNPPRSDRAGTMMTFREKRFLARNNGVDHLGLGLGINRELRIGCDFSSRSELDANTIFAPFPPRDIYLMNCSS